jgi:asparagine synthetase B (glutamine-hydrolysing)
VILAPENALNMIKVTINSINYHYPNISHICVTDSSASKEEILEIKKHCPTYKGKETITSLINVGMRHAPLDWVFLIFAGTNVRPRLDEKFSFYVGSEKDILFPVAEKKHNFIEATLNGLFMNKKIVVALSGGMDSTTLLGYYLHEGIDVHVVSFAYGSKHNPYELKGAREIVDYYTEQDSNKFDPSWRRARG